MSPALQFSLWVLTLDINRDHSIWGGVAQDRAVHLSRRVLNLFYQLLVLADLLDQFLITLILGQELVHVPLGFLGDQELVLVVEFEVLDGGHALSQHHLLNLLFVSVDNLAQDYGLQGCRLGFAFLSGGGGGGQCHVKCL